MSNNENEIGSLDVEIGYTISNLTSNMQGKYSHRKHNESSHHKINSNDLKRQEISNQESNNFSVKTGQPLCLKSFDKQESISQINIIPSLYEIKRGETNSDFNTNRVFMFNKHNHNNNNEEESNSGDMTQNSLFIFSHLKKATKQQFTSFLLSPIQKKVWLRCKIKKEKDKNNASLYYFYLSNLEDDDLLMIIASSTSKKYNMYTNVNYNSNTMIPIAKLKKNFLGTHFSLTTAYEDFFSPKMHINYSINLLGMTGPMGMKVKLPLENNEETYLLRNKLPVYSERFKCYVLDYIDRKSVQCSAKNFQLVSMKDRKTNKINNEELDSEEKTKILLQFGVIENNNYILDFKYPLSPIQAFAIAISNLNNKIMCE